MAIVGQNRGESRKIKDGKDQVRSDLDSGFLSMEFRDLSQTRFVKSFNNDLVAIPVCLAFVSLRGVGEQIILLSTFQSQCPESCRYRLIRGDRVHGRLSLDRRRQIFARSMGRKSRFVDLIARNPADALVYSFVRCFSASRGVFGEPGNRKSAR